MLTPTSRELVRRAWQAGTAIPSFNIPYLPMMAPVIRALQDTDTLGQVTTARVEWKNFQAGGIRAVWEEYQRVADPRVVRLHLDHIPVIDEEDQRVDYLALLGEALELGYDSVMVDASRLALAENIAATREVVELAARPGAAVEGELGAVLGHEAGPLPPYEELFASGRGFTDPAEARRFVAETGVDWLSVAVGNIHGAVVGAAKSARKVQARLNLDHLAALREATGVPLVLHGGTGIQPADVQAGIRLGLAKINIATALRQPYEALMGQSVTAAGEAVYEETRRLVAEELQLAGSATRLLGEGE